MARRFLGDDVLRMLTLPLQLCAQSLKRLARSFGIAPAQAAEGMLAACAPGPASPEPMGFEGQYKRLTEIVEAARDTLARAEAAHAKASLHLNAASYGVLVLQREMPQLSYSSPTFHQPPASGERKGTGTLAVGARDGRRLVRRVEGNGVRLPVAA